jgi:cytochrome c
MSSTLKDPDGKAYQREKLAIKDTGWVTYRWLNPLTKAIEPKTMFIVHRDGYAVGVGAYAK